MIEKKQIVAKISGEILTKQPKDLYIPADALEIILEAFEGPLDLLLYLIKKQNVDILNIPIAEITTQYMNYMALMGQVHFDLAAEYLVMAALLAEIKSRMLLPQSILKEEDESDPRAELIRRLQAYERFKKAAEDLHQYSCLGKDVYQIKITSDKVPVPEINVDLNDLLLAFKAVLKRTDLCRHHQIKKETLSLRDRMSHVLSLLEDQTAIPFQYFFNIEEGRDGVVVSFMAILELAKEALIEISQKTAFSPIYLQLKSH